MSSPKAEEDLVPHPLTPVAETVAPPEGAEPESPVARGLPPVRPTVRFLLRSPAHLIALGFGSGLSPLAPGTVGTLWAWVAWLVLSNWLGPVGWAWVLGLGLPVSWWSSTVTARALRTSDPGAIVVDEVLAFWLILWLWMPASVVEQTAAFALFRLLDAWKPGPIGWADRYFKPAKAPDGTPLPPGWSQGFGILFDDLVAALCTLFVLALWRFWT